MKKVINGRMYNTDTAKLVASYANGGGWGDFHHFEEGLYQKKTGEFFLHGEGGAKTAYSRQIDCNCWTGGAKIIPLTEKEAKKMG